MATLSNITLSTASGPTSTSKNVTVKGAMTFDSADVGKIFRLEILIFGEDPAGDKLPAEDPVGDDLLYTFSWGSLFIKKPYKEIKVSAPGIVPITETRTIGDETLDEDKGKVQIGDADINTPVLVVRKDEVHARVSLSGAPVSARSPTLTLSPFGL
jgi:hypothetical protein